MEEKSNVIVFDRIEVVLIFVFVLLLSATCLVLGYKIGHREGKKKLEAIEAELKQVPVEEDSVDLKSRSEEEADQITEEVNKDGKPAIDSGESLNRLKDEFEDVDKADPAKSGGSSSAPNKDQTSVNGLQPSDEMRGQFTVQLGSYPDLEDAKTFAKAFEAQGYNPVIHQVNVGGGVWFRVGLGVFKSVAEAKKYIQKEQALFQNNDKYFIAEIK